MLEPKIFNIQQLMIMTQYRVYTNCWRFNVPAHMNFTFFVAPTWASVSDPCMLQCNNELFIFKILTDVNIYIMRKPSFLNLPR